MGEFAVSIEHSEAISVSASRGLRPPDPPYRLTLRALAMAPLDCGPPAGGKLTKWPAVSKRLDSTGLVVDTLCLIKEVN